MLHCYITLAAAADPHHIRQIEFYDDYYPHVPITSTQFSATQILKTITSAIFHWGGKANILTTWQTLWIKMDPTNVSTSMMERDQCAQSKTNLDTSINHASAKVKQLRHCLAASPHGQDGCCSIEKIETSGWSVASGIWSTGWSLMRLRRCAKRWQQRRLSLEGMMRERRCQREE